MVLLSFVPPPGLYSSDAIGDAMLYRNYLIKYYSKDNFYFNEELCYVLAVLSVPLSELPFLIDKEVMSVLHLFSYKKLLKRTQFHGFMMKSVQIKLYEFCRFYETDGHLIRYICPGFTRRIWHQWWNNFRKDMTLPNY